MKIVIFAISVCASFAEFPTAPQTAASNYTANTNTPQQSSGNEIFWKEGKNSATDCANRCNSWIGCVGFTYQYEDATASTAKKGKCEGFQNADDLMYFVQTDSNVNGFVYYQRDAMSATTSTVAPMVSFKGESVLGAAAGYVVWDKLGCQKDAGGDMKAFSIGKKTKDLTKEECAQMCESWVGCFAIGHTYAGTYKGHCTGFKKGTKVGGFGCELSSKDNEAIYPRLAGAVVTAKCAPQGTDNKGFRICTAGGVTIPTTKAFSGASATSSLSIAALLLAPLVAVWLH